MSDKPTNEEPDKPAVDQERGKEEYVAVGIGCLVVLIFFGSLALAAFLSDG